ncbi:fluoride efflux transporter CrcB [Streptomyces sp. JJ66]|uniref:fluoride efflux transporter CrcB n=1 Tax=Streptomyces sp. JJ66 TaxID=2803843 RepID=UPI001C581D51|nr:fluoride efflux transporter CrcB [Streptomyces sp. JJ66]MBW1604676.1 fluoride efflux transporter CrcB [Streptomyces sp. JJ66]
MTWWLVALGAAVGAPLRYLADRAVQTRHDSVFPWGTFTVNVAGSLLLGLVAGAVRAGALGGPADALLGTGLCGALTTYSTFSYENLRLLERGRGVLALVNSVGTLGAGLLALWAGSGVARLALG